MDRDAVFFLTFENSRNFEYIDFISVNFCRLVLKTCQNIHEQQNPLS